jgi:hypothetical protein
MIELGWLIGGRTTDQTVQLDLTDAEAPALVGRR